MTPGEEAGIAVILPLIQAEESGEFEPMPVWFGPYSAFITVSALQLAWRHPELGPDLKAIVEQVGRDIQSAFGGPAGELLEQGWDPARDVEGNPR